MRAPARSAAETRARDVAAGLALSSLVLATMALLAQDSGSQEASEAARLARERPALVIPQAEGFSNEAHRAETAQSLAGTTAPGATPAAESPSASAIEPANADAALETDALAREPVARRARPAREAAVAARLGWVRGDGREELLADWFARAAPKDELPGLLGARDAAAIATGLTSVEAVEER